MNIALQFAHQSEKDFVDALVRQKSWAQQALYEEYYGKMMGLCLRYAGSHDEARDMLQEGFIKVFQHIGRYQQKPGISLGAWIRTVMVNNCIDAYRKESRRRSSPLDEAYHLCDPDPSILSRLSEAEIMAAIQALSPAYRAVFNLFVIDGYSHKEIADILQINESTARSNLVKARIKLQEILQNRLQTPDK